MKRSLSPLLLSLLLAACGGGGDSGGGGGGGGGNYSISVNPTSASFSGLTGAASIPSQDITVTFNGAGVVVGTLPGQTSLPPWLIVNAPNIATSPVAVTLSVAPNTAPGSYSTTLRFVTGKADGTNVVFVDVPVSFQMQQGQVVFAEPFGQATGSQLAVSLNAGAARNLTSGISTQLGVIASGTSYTVSVPTQPTGQTCTFPDGNSTSTGMIGPTNQVQLRVTCNASLIGWTYVGGSKNTGDPPVYGTRGTPAAGNTPGGRTPGATARDAAGNLWVFGGRDATGSRNDLWRYNVSTGQWTWMSGGTGYSAGGSYGTLNTASASNVPGARYGSVAWFDASGNFWLFGGNGFVAPALPDAMNDLWMYDVAGDTWTWVGGSNTGGLNALGTYGPGSSTINIPGFRWNASVAKQGTDTVWFFGGYGAGEINSSGRMNDLWRFTPSTREWEWMSGANQPIQTRVQGTLGVPNAANYPSARDGVSAWVDTSGDFWLFGGTNSVAGFENDLWRYNPGTDMWTWMGGADRTVSTVVPSRGTYNPPGTANNYPTSRGFASSWTDASGSFWLFGGYGQANDFNSTNGPVNDLWKYSPSTNTWSWLSGSNAVSSPAIYGTTGVAANTNVPSGRQGSAAWTDTTGRLWLWGGPTNLSPSGYTNDVWRVVPQ